MASRKEYAAFILDQPSGLEEITCRAMMGEYVLYYRGKILGGIYGDRLPVRPVPSAVTLLPGAKSEAPYPGAKEMLLVEAVDSRAFLTRLVTAMYGEPPKKRK